MTEPVCPIRLSNRRFPCEYTMRSILTLLFLSTVACGGKDTTGTAPDVDEEVDNDGDGFTEDADCDDNDSAVNPDASEVCDGLDNDCDGTVDEDAEDAAVFYADTDGDGFGNAAAPSEACDQPSGTVTDSTDCDDASDITYPEAEELCDGLDNDCDSAIDEDGLSLWYADSDSDGFGDAADAIEDCGQPKGRVADDSDCDDADETSFPGGKEVCDGVDNNCDGTIDEGVTTTFYADTDSDGQGDAESTAEACSVPSGYVSLDTDCDDTDGTISPNGTEVCDGVDNDCDGTTDEGDAIDAATWYADSDSDGFGDVDSATVACDQPSGYLANDTDCDDTDSAINPDGTEVCDESDNDCDGETDEDSAVDAATWYTDSDSDGFGDVDSTTVACDQPSGTVADDTDCDDGDSAINPDGEEVCDGADNDCDSTTSEDGTVWFLDASDGSWSDLTSTFSGDVTFSDPGDLSICAGTWDVSVTIEMTGDFSVIGPAGSDNTILDGSASETVLRAKGGGYTLLEGLTLTNGYGTSGENGDSGGGLFCRDSSLSASDLQIIDNAASFEGGGIHVRGICDMTFSDTSVTENSAWLGGGVSFAEATVSFSDSVISDNTATYYGGAVYMIGGDLSFSSGELSNNTSGYYGGGFFGERRGSVHLRQ